MADIEIPELPLEAEVKADELVLEDKSGGCASYAFIGAGQGGGRLAESFYKLGYTKTICVNTAKQDLAPLGIPEDQKVLLPAGEQGAGKDMRIGEDAAEKGQQAVYELMLQKFGKVDHIFICVGAGGGSGGGASLVMLETAKKFLAYTGVDGIDGKVGVIMTLPTNGESASPTVANNAQLVANTLCEFAKNKQLSPLVIVDNDKIQKLFPNLTVKDFWPRVNDTVAGLFHTFNLIPTKDTQYTTFDAADYSSLMCAGGCMIMGVTAVKDFSSAGGVAAAIKGNLEKTLLADGFDLRTATHAAAIVLGGQKIFESAPGLMGSIEGGFDTLSVLTGKAMVHRGVYEDQKDRLNVYTLVGGLSAPEKRISALTRFQEAKGIAEKKVESYGNRLYGE